MGAYLAKPDLEKVSEDGKNERLRYGASAMQGWRLAQEDDHNCLPSFAENSELFGVYDGHGGPEVAVYCAKHFPGVIKGTPAFKSGDLEKGLEEAFLKFDKQLKEEKVIEELKEIAGVNNCSDAEEDEVDNLQEEAHLPLGELLTKFGVPGSTKNQRALRKKVQPEDLLSPVVTNKKRPVFPFLKEGDEKGTQPDLANGADTGSEGTNGDNTEAVPGENGSDKPEDKVAAEAGADITDGETDSKEAENDKDGGKTSKTEDHSKDAASGKKESQKEPDAVCNGTSGEGDTKTQGDNHKSPETDKEDGCPNGDEAVEDGEDDLEDEELDEEEEEWEDEEEGEDDGTMPPASGREEPGSDSGTTACVALLHGNEIIVANIGDSRCVLSREGKAVDLSVDHKPEDDEELKRIEAAGGKVTLDGRVNGGLNLSRAFGDHCYKTNTDLPPEEQMISPFPDIQRMARTDKDEFMVVACDGIWNAMTSQEVVDFVKERLDADSSIQLSSICEELFDLCLAPDTSGDGTGCDNMTCIIVAFSGNEVGNPTGGKRKAQPSHQGKTDAAPKRKRPKV